MLFRDVGKHEEVRERAGDRTRGGDRKRGQCPLESILIGGAALTGALGQGTDGLDGLEHLGALEGLQRVAEDRTEQADIVAEWLVWIVWHGVMNTRTDRLGQG